MIPDYDIGGLLEQMELDLIASYKRNLLRHSAEQIKEGFEWPMWQILKLQDLKQFKAEAQKLSAKYGADAGKMVEQAINGSFKGGAINADNILQGLNIDIPDISDSSFFQSNMSQAEALISAVHHDLGTAQTAVLRMSDDVFRQTIYKAQTFYTNGATNLYKAVDMASKDFLNRGYNCIEYKNGARVNVSDYSEMVLRTSAKKAYMVGEGKRSEEYGCNLCQVTQYSACSPICQQWQGKVYIDDVYAGGKPDGKHMLLSKAIAGGLFHPHCRHIKQPYYEGISEPLKTIDNNDDNYEAEQRQRAIESNIRKFKRRAAGELDGNDIQQSQQKVKSWQDELKKHLADNPQLRRNPAKEQIYD